MSIHCFNFPGSTEANARLITAAPDGLLLAQAIVAWYENAGNADPDQSSIGSVELWQKAKAFITKATGAS